MQKGGRLVCYGNGSEEPTTYSSTSSPVPLHLQNTVPNQLPLKRTPATTYPAETTSSWIGSDQLNQIKEDVDMIGLIESYDLGQFKRVPPNRATALCPFHDDRNPSLRIDAKRGLYKCFSCGASGDVFNFVRQHHKMHHTEEMPFIESVRRVQAFHACGDINRPNAVLTDIWLPRLTGEEQKVQLRKRERVYAMNQDAAAFYAKCLTLPFAGGARFYLQSRGFESPSAVRAFALGYAPDVYFGARYLPKGQKSLVLHLVDCGYTPSEILESGLATQINKKNHKVDEIKQAVKDADTQNVQITSLMDRFRGRLIVPIFDKSGQKVVGFGGRVLPVYNEEREHGNSNGFKAPKYLNSPDTAVFQKKNIVFGLHMVLEECRHRSTKAAGASDLQSTRSDVLMVEGYMDVLALWDIGIKTAVATMGTAVSLDQVNAAGRVAGATGGRVVLCLDNDEAGYAAVERLCSGGYLRKESGSSAVQFCIATLSPGVKDPGDYIDQQRGKGTPSKMTAIQFWEDVVEPAQEWSEWFLGEILDRYDVTAPRNAAGSFGDVFQRVANFLSTFSNPAERTKGAYEVARKLADLMAKESNSTTASQAAQMQLESDLIDSASRIANAREAQKRRSEMLRSDAHSWLAPSSLGSVSVEQPAGTEMLSKKALEELNGNLGQIENTDGTRLENDGVERRKVEVRDQEKSRPRRRMHRSLIEKESPPLTPHFAGFQFENPTDAAWLGIPKNKAEAGNSILTLGELNSCVEPKVFPRKARSGSWSKPVYFNSNEYHGHRFVSSDAVAAGYSDTLQVSRFSSIQDKGVASLVQHEAAGTLVSTEDAFLRGLVTYYPQSRNAVKEILQASTSAGSAVEIEWSSPEREWLFTRLMEDNGLDQCNASRYDPPVLRAVLAGIEDAPTGAFREGSDSDAESSTALMPATEEATPNTTNSLYEVNLANPKEGTLDHLFDEKAPSSDTASNCPEDVLARSEKAAFDTQEHWMNLLLAHAAHQIELIQNELNSVSFVLQCNAGKAPAGQSNQPILEDVVKRDELAQSTELAINMKMSSDVDWEVEAFTASSKKLSDSSGSLQFENMSRDNLQQHYEDLLTRFQTAIEHRNQLDQSTKRITERLLRFSGSSEELVEGRVSIPLQKQLAGDLDDHLDSIDDINSHTDHDYGLATGDGTSESAVFDELAEIESNWGDWCNDDFIWSPEKTSRNDGVMATTVVSINGLEDDEVENESVEETLERISEDWKYWID